MYSKHSAPPGFYIECSLRVVRVETLLKRAHRTTATATATATATVGSSYVDLN
jgi:hypothetical protein